MTFHGTADEDEFILTEFGATAAAMPAPQVEAPSLAFGPPPSISRDFEGTPFADDIRGTFRDDVIFSRGGSDFVRGRDGDDIIDGGRGPDLLFGGDGRDDIWGGRGEDSIYGGRGRDFFWFDEESSFDKIRDFRGGDRLVVDGAEGDFAGARMRDIDIVGGSRYDQIYVFDDLVARVFGDVVIRDDILLIT